MKKGLVLEGGAMRGLFSAGVMDVLMEIIYGPMALLAFLRVQLLVVI